MSGYTLKAALAVLSLTAVSPAVQAADLVLGLKDYRQLPATFSSITSVATTDPQIASYLTKVRSLLPHTGAVNEVSAGSIRATLGLGGAFCAAMIAKDAALAPEARLAHQGVDFTLAPHLALTKEVQAKVSDSYAQLFWFRPATAAEGQVLDELFSSTLSTVDIGSTSAALLPVCTAVAASVATIIN